MLKKAVNMDPAFSRAYALMGQISVINAGNRENPSAWLDSSLLYAKAAVYNDADSEDGYLALGHYYSRSEGPEAASKWYLNAYSINPAVGLLQNGYSYLRNGKFQPAMEQFCKMVMRDPLDARGYMGKAEVYARLGMVDSTEKNLVRARQVVPDFVVPDLAVALAEFQIQI